MELSHGGASCKRDVAAPPGGPAAGAGAAGGAAAAVRLLVAAGRPFTAEVFALMAISQGFAARLLVPAGRERLQAELRTFEPSVVLVDVDSLPRHACLECLALMRRAGVPAAFIGETLDVLAACVDAGARFAMDKGIGLTELGAILRRLAELGAETGEEGRRSLGNSIRDERLEARLAEQLRARRARLAPFRVLTHREQLVLAALMEGHDAGAIAAGDHVAMSTVRSQIKTVLQKLGVRSQLKATAMARQAGWALDEDGWRPY